MVPDTACLLTLFLLVSAEKKGRALKWYQQNKTTESEIRIGWLGHHHNFYKAHQFA